MPDSMRLLLASIILNIKNLLGLPALHNKRLPLLPRLPSRPAASHHRFITQVFFVIMCNLSASNIGTGVQSGDVDGDGPHFLPSTFLRPQFSPKECVRSTKQRRQVLGDPRKMCT